MHKAICPSSSKGGGGVNIAIHVDRTDKQTITYYMSPTDFSDRGIIKCRIYIDMDCSKLPWKQFSTKTLSLSASSDVNMVDHDR